jgi:hypothetical protein
VPDSTPGYSAYHTPIAAVVTLRFRDVRPNVENNLFISFRDSFVGMRYNVALGVTQIAQFVC